MIRFITYWSLILSCILFANNSRAISVTAGAAVAATTIVALSNTTAGANVSICKKVVKSDKFTSKEKRYCKNLLNEREVPLWAIIVIILVVIVGGFLIFRYMEP